MLGVYQAPGIIVCIVDEDYSRSVGTQLGVAAACKSEGGAHQVLLVCRTSRVSFPMLTFDL